MLKYQSAHMDAHRVLTALYAFPLAHVAIEYFKLCQSAEIFYWGHLLVVLRGKEALQWNVYIEQVTDKVDSLFIWFANTICVVIRIFPELALHDSIDITSNLFNNIRSHTQFF